AQPVCSVLPAWLQQIFLAGWVVVPMTEIAVAAGLLVPRLRNAAVIAAVGTHLIVLGLLGPLAHGTNAVIWPWNAAMAGLAAVLFWNARDASARDTLVPPRIRAHPGLLRSFGGLPV